MIIGCYDCDVSSTFVWMEGCHIHSMDGGGNFVHWLISVGHFIGQAFYFANLPFELRWNGVFCSWAHCQGNHHPERYYYLESTRRHCRELLHPHTTRQWQFLIAATNDDKAGIRPFKPCRATLFNFWILLLKLQTSKPMLGRDKLVTANPNAVDD